jgi:hypothetical protein
MSDIITGLKYQPPYLKVETEQQILEVFADLRQQYQKLSKNFRISLPEGGAIKDFSDFLRHSTQRDQFVRLNGSGYIEGLIVNDASLEYDLSEVGKLITYWDIRRDGSCHSCHNLGREHDSLGGGEWYCSININPMKWSNCPKYDSIVKNSKGEPARNLDELILDAIKE